MCPTPSRLQNPHSAPLFSRTLSQIYHHPNNNHPITGRTDDYEEMRGGRGYGIDFQGLSQCLFFLSWTWYTMKFSVHRFAPWKPLVCQGSSNTSAPRALLKTTRAHSPMYRVNTSMRKTSTKILQTDQVKGNQGILTPITFSGIKRNSGGCPKSWPCLVWGDCHRPLFSVLLYHPHLSPNFQDTPIIAYS